MAEQTEDSESKSAAPKATKSSITKKVTVDVEIFVKVFSVVATLLGLGVGIWEFSTQQANNSKMEFRRKIWEKQMDTYNDLGRLVGKASTVQDDTCALKELLKQYEEFYWGRLSIFQDSLIERNMCDYMRSIRQKIEGKKDLFDDDPVRTRAFALMQCCDTSLKRRGQELAD